MDNSWATRNSTHKTKALGPEIIAQFLLSFLFGIFFGSLTAVCFDGFWGHTREMIFRHRNAFSVMFFILLWMLNVLTTRHCASGLEICGLHNFDFFAWSEILKFFALKIFCTVLPFFCIYENFLISLVLLFCIICSSNFFLKKNWKCSSNFCTMKTFSRGNKNFVFFPTEKCTHGGLQTQVTYNFYFFAKPLPKIRPWVPFWARYWKHQGVVLFLWGDLNPPKWDPPQIKPPKIRPSLIRSSKHPKNKTPSWRREAPGRVNFFPEKKSQKPPFQTHIWCHFKDFRILKCKILKVVL